MADYQTFRNLITSTIKADVPAAGQVQSYERNIFDWNKYIEAFVGSVQGKRQPRGWWVTREQRIHDYEVLGGSTAGFRIYNARHIFVIRGILGVQDGQDTDGVFGDLCDDVMEALETMTVTGAWVTGPAIQRVNQPRVFGPVLCHYTEIAYTIQKLSG